ncbi:MAG: hypothetical protein ACRD4Y_07320, partial [Candidatus Acidiferrales bacterium]
VLCRQLEELRASMGVEGSDPIRAKIKEIVTEYSYEPASSIASRPDSEGIKTLEKAAGQKV